MPMRPTSPVPCVHQASIICRQTAAADIRKLQSRRIERAIQRRRQEKRQLCPPSKRTGAVCLLLSPPAITTPLASSDQSRHPARNRCTSSLTYHIPPTTPADRQYERPRRFHPGQGYVVVVIVVAVAAISSRKRRYRRGFPQRIAY